MKSPLAVLLVLAAGAASAQDGKLPLPDGPVVVVIPDAAAFDRALTGGFRKAASGTLSPSDPVRAAWNRTRVGGKLIAQWETFAKDLPLSWPELMKLQPSSLGLTLLSAGNLEAVLALRTSAAQLALPVPGGAEKSHKGVAYRLVSRGAGDDRTADRRIGLAWARARGHLLIATSERAMTAAIDALVADAGAGPFLPGLVSMKLDLDALRKDLYFRREFLFDEGSKGPETGIVTAALRAEGNDLVEVREGTGETRPPAARWSTGGRDVAAAGWESDPARLVTALRRGLLEPIPSPPARPVAALAALPPLDPGPSDRYRTDLTKAAPVQGPWGEGELPRWSETLSSLGGWGWELGRSGARRLVVRCGAKDEKGIRALALETARRRAGSGVEAGDELRIGPDLPALAFHRSGDYLWIGASASELSGVPEPKPETAVVRWSTLDLTEVRHLGAAWAAAEGAFSAEDSGRTRPFSDRILGLLGWMPRTTALTTERRREPQDRFTERIVLTGEAAPPEKAPAAPPAPKPAAKPAPKKTKT